MFRPLRQDAVAIVDGQRVRITVEDADESESADMRISATALEHGVLVATNSLSDFRRITGLQIDNWLADGKATLFFRQFLPHADDDKGTWKRDGER